MRMHNYIEKINKFLLSEVTSKMKLCFDLYDRNSDGKICIVDIYRTLNELTDDDYFIKNDIALLSRLINKKN